MIVAIVQLHFSFLVFCVARASRPWTRFYSSQPLRVLPFSCHFSIRCVVWAKTWPRHSTESMNGSTALPGMSVQSTFNDMSSRWFALPRSRSGYPYLHRWTVHGTHSNGLCRPATPTSWHCAASTEHNHQISLLYFRANAVTRNQIWVDKK